jgi:hypothetical protein
MEGYRPPPDTLVSKTVKRPPPNSYYGRKGMNWTDNYPEFTDTANCFIRATSIALEKSYEDSYKEVSFLIEKNNDPPVSPNQGVYLDVMINYMESVGWKWNGVSLYRPQRNDVLVGGYLRDVPKKGCFVVLIFLPDLKQPKQRYDGHALAVIDGTIHEHSVFKKVFDEHAPLWGYFS